ncbi:hypothetical protein ACTZWW_04040 [Salinarimonas sp. NSM]|uniref:hypothetical protein n=1 Tax=Salinarimonas sp. NSM TaxID=3458003 RepID=UPI004036DD42
MTAPRTPELYGAIGDGQSHPLSESYATLEAAQAVFPCATSLAQEHDLVAIQTMLDEGGRIERRNHGARYFLGVGQGLRLKHHGQEIVGALCDLVYAGPGVALDTDDAVAASGYLASCLVERVHVELTAPGAVGLRDRTKNSRWVDCAANLMASGQVGIEWAGGVGGSGPYYNTWDNPVVAGRAIHGFSNVRGLVCTFDPAYPSRGPNAMRWEGGRVSGCSRNFSLLGTGNVLDNPKSEAAVDIHFFVDHPGHPNGCIANTVEYPYIEAMATSTALYVGPRSVAANLYEGKTTSVGTLIVDHGIRTTFVSSDKGWVPTLRVGGPQGAGCVRLLSREGVISFGTVPAGKTGYGYISVPGALAGDLVMVTPRSTAASADGLSYWGQVATTGLVAVYAKNGSGGAVTLPPLEFRVAVMGFAG